MDNFLKTFSELSQEDEERLTYEKRLEEAEQADRSYYEEQED